MRKWWGAQLRRKQLKPSCRGSAEPLCLPPRPKTSDQVAQGLLEAVRFRSVSVLTAGQESGMPAGNIRWLEGVAPQMVQEKAKISIPGAVDTL